MSLHVYVANSRFKEEPISYSAWIDAAISVAASNEALVICERENSRTGKAHAFAHLRSSKRQNMSLNPYGLVHAQDPNIELIRLMFQIAEKLNAAVYSETLKIYESPEDWEQRTKQYRQRSDERYAKYKKQKITKVLLFLTVAVLGALGVFLLSRGGSL